MYIILVLSIVALGLIIYYYIKTYDPKGEKVKKDLNNRNPFKKKSAETDEKWASARPNLAEPGDDEEDSDHSKVVEISVK